MCWVNQRHCQETFSKGIREERFVRLCVPPMPPSSSNLAHRVFCTIQARDATLVRVTEALLGFDHCAGRGFFDATCSFAAPSSAIRDVIVRHHHATHDALRHARMQNEPLATSKGNIIRFFLSHPLEQGMHTHH